MTARGGHARQAGFIRLVFEVSYIYADKFARSEKYHYARYNAARSSNVSRETEDNMSQKLDLSNAVWRKSSRSTNDGACVEFAAIDIATVSGGSRQSVVVRDSKDPNGHVLVFSRHAWSDFIVGIKIGNSDLPAAIAE